VGGLNSITIGLLGPWFHYSFDVPVISQSNIFFSGEDYVVRDFLVLNSPAHELILNTKNRSKKQLNSFYYYYRNSEVLGLRFLFSAS
jgi:hypothetical protein